MALPRRALSSYNKDDIFLASSSLNAQQLKGSRRAAVYDVCNEALAENIYMASALYNGRIADF
ncbi:hypothetical protein A1F99_089840 [Pyrenophora tritici-repentis]|nr:hypothetical protein A1F99_089840 [Pyrenophora tritici-repentis]